MYRPLSGNPIIQFTGLFRLNTLSWLNGTGFSTLSSGSIFDSFINPGFHSEFVALKNHGKPCRCQQKLTRGGGKIDSQRPGVRKTDQRRFEGSKLEAFLPLGLVAPKSVEASMFSFPWVDRFLSESPAGQWVSESPAGR